MSLLTIDEAHRNICEATRASPIERVRLADAPGRVLADNVVCDLDSPPFAKAMMDGYAVRTAEIAPKTSLPVAGEVAAGAAEVPALRPGTAVRIMTGAPVPNGADAVIPVEQSTLTEATNGETSSAVSFATVPKLGANVLEQGGIAHQGDMILSAGTVVEAGQLAALAEFGCSEVTVARRPRVAILATGNELVEHDVVPGPGQIRNSNGPMLAALVAQMGATAIPLGVARDEIDDLDAKIAAGLEADVLLLSGGVSAGAYDLVPGRLAAAGVAEIFHKVAIKPGKPLWFGSSESALVFGLPGNPVSSLVCCLVFVQAAIRKMLRQSPAKPVSVRCVLSESHRQKGDRTTYWPAKWAFTSDGPVVKPLAWKGSADLVRVAAANCWAVFPPGDRTFEAGDAIDVIPQSGF